MLNEVITDAFCLDVVEWLQENVGSLLWCRPNVEWKGQGWTLNAYGYNKSKNKTYYMIRIGNDKLGMLAQLKWGSYYING